MRVSLSNHEVTLVETDPSDMKLYPNHLAHLFFVSRHLLCVCVGLGVFSFSKYRSDISHL